MTEIRKTICLTGATGFIGSHLLHELIKKNYDVRCITAQPEKLDPDLSEKCTIYPYAEMEQACKAADICIHLGARNNDQGGTRDTYIADNVTATLSLAKTAEEGGCGRFIFVTTTHALKLSTTSEYAYSKRLAEQGLRQGDFGDMRISLFRLPPVYGAGSRGTLSKLDILPRTLRYWVLRQIRSCTAITSVETVIQDLMAIIEADFPVLEHVSSDPIKAWSLYSFFKLTVNVAFILVCLLLLPILLLVGVIVTLTSKGGALFTQKRVGVHGKEFTCIKFRTMQTGTKQAGTHEVNAASVTKIGKFLRRSKLDELPQAINIIKGEMTLIGPRPCLPNQIDVIKHRQYQGVLRLTPGISGLAQVNNIDMSTPEDLAVYDQRYLGCQSVLSDLKIIKFTALGQGQGDLVKTEDSRVNRDLSGDKDIK